MVGEVGERSGVLDDDMKFLPGAVDGENYTPHGQGRIRPITSPGLHQPRL
jgi:hypothetical protein